MSVPLRNRPGVACLVRGLAIASLYVAATIGSPLQAQSLLRYDRTAFVHGLASSPAIWTTPYWDLGWRTTPDYLQSQRSILLKQVLTPGTDPDPNRSTRFVGQRNTLASVFATSPDTQVIVGHSLGGVLSRSLYINEPGLRPRVAGLVTVASPHQGADIAYYSPVLRQFFREFDPAVAAGLREIRNLIGLGSAILTVVGAVIHPVYGTLLGAWASGLLEFMSKDLDGALPSTGLLAQMTLLPVLGDLAPAVRPGPGDYPAEFDSVGFGANESNIASLNAATADAGLPRASVIGSLDHAHAALRLYASIKNNEDLGNQLIRDRNRAVGAFKKCQRVAGNLFMPGKAQRCRRARRMLNHVDFMWSGSTVGWRQVTVSRPTLSCVVSITNCTTVSTTTWQAKRDIESDGVVPNYRSVIPSGGDIRTVIKVNGRNHLSIYKMQDGANAIAQAMLAIGVRHAIINGTDDPPPPPPPPPPPTAFLSGRSMVPHPTSCQWTASVSEGTPPFTLRWYRSGTLLKSTTVEEGGSDTMTIPSVSGGFTVKAAFVDAAGRSAESQMSVSIGQTSGFCLSEDPDV